MKKHLLLFITIIPLFSLGQVTFQTNISSGNYTECNTNAVYQLSDQSYYTLDYSVDLSSCSSGLAFVSNSFVHLSSKGDIIRRNYAGGSINCFIFNKDEILYLSGYNILTAIDSNEDTLLVKQLPDSIYCNFLGATSDNFLIAILGFKTLEKMDTNGNIVYAKTFSLGSPNTLAYCFPSADSGVYLIEGSNGYFPDGGVYVVNNVIVKYNSSLDSIWSKPLNPNASLYETPDYHLVSIVQDANNEKHITTFDNNLDTLRSINFNDGIEWNILWQLSSPRLIYPLNDGGIIYTSNNPVYPLPNISERIDSLGNTLWSRQLSPLDSSAFFSDAMIQTSDGGFLFGGSHDGSHPKGEGGCLGMSTSVVIKTDGMGNFISGINELSNQDNSVLIYPNPFSTSATIEIKGNAAGGDKMNFLLYDVLGKEVKRINSVKTVFQVERDNLSDGMYFYEINDGTKVLGKGKLLIE